MSEQQNIEVVRKAYEAFGRGDIPGLLSTMHTDVSWVTPGPADLLTAGVRRGHDAVRGFFGALSEIVDIVSFETDEFLAQGTKVVVLGREMARVKATGANVEYRWVHIFELRDGKVAGFEERGDVTAVVTEVRAALA